MITEFIVVGLVTLVTGLSVGFFWGEWLGRQSRERPVIRKACTKVDTDRFDASMEISKHYYQCFTDRRIYEWKLNFSFWAGIALLTKGCMDADLDLSVKHAIFGGYFGLFLIYFVWTKGHWWANEMDIRKFAFYRSHAESELFMVQELSLPDPNEPSVIRGVLANWSRQVQLLTTIAVLLFSWFLIMFSEK